MKGFVSVYLDLLRFLAALGVFLSHVGEADYPFSAGVLPNMDFNHALVIIFFVISGYVIAASADRPDRTLGNYAADRLARLSSVVVPALILTFCLDAIGSRITPIVYSLVDYHWQSIRLLINFLYCQQIWTLCVNPCSDRPLWSLGYEFWYYVLFGVWVFARSIRWKVALLLAVAIFIGPKILLLLPAWVVGAIAFHLGKKYQLGRRTSLLLFILTSVIMVGAIAFDKQLGLSNGKPFTYPLFYSVNYLGDNLLGMLVAANFFFCAQLSQNMITNLDPFRWVKLTRWLSKHTFSLYVYHMPLLFFVCAITRYDPHSCLAVAVATLVVLLCVIILSRFTEERYPVLRTAMRRWMKAVQIKIVAFMPAK